MKIKCSFLAEMRMWHFVLLLEILFSFKDIPLAYGYYCRFTQFVNNLMIKLRFMKRVVDFAPKEIFENEKRYFEQIDRKSWRI